MSDRRLTNIVKSLPASIPFVAPEEHERIVGQKFSARLGANENCYGPSPKVLEAVKTSLLIFGIIQIKQPLI